MEIREKAMTVEEFEVFALLPENADRLLEFVGGRIVEVVSDNLASETGMSFGVFVSAFVKQHRLGRVTGADGGYWVAGERYIPDVAFISKARQPTRVRAAYNPLAPDLAVEVLSPTNNAEDMRIKIANYLSAGTVVWLADPDVPRIEVYVPGQPVKILGMDDVLDGGEVLPGFSVAVRDLFED